MVPLLYLYKHAYFYDLPKNCRVVNFEVMKSEKSFRPVAKLLRRYEVTKTNAIFYQGWLNKGLLPELLSYLPLISMPGHRKPLLMVYFKHFYYNLQKNTEILQFEKFTFRLLGFGTIGGLPLSHPSLTILVTLIAKIKSYMSL